MNRRNSLSILPIFILLFFLQTKTKNLNNNTTNKKTSKDYELTETEARDKINKDIIKKFGQTCSLFLSSLRFSKEEAEKRKFTNQEIQEFEKIRDEELASGKNYKITIIQVPVEKKEYYIKNLSNNIIKKIVERIGKKSYSYALLETDENTAKKVKSQITKELTEKIKSGDSLKEFISKVRETKIDKLIKEHTDKDNPNKTKKKRKNIRFVKSKRCPVCYKSFKNKNVKRMFLLPCGHNICTHCLSKHSNKCPVCGKKIESSTPE